MLVKLTPGWRQQEKGLDAATVAQQYNTCLFILGSMVKVHPMLQAPQDGEKGKKKCLEMQH